MELWNYPVVRLCAVCSVFTLCVARDSNSRPGQDDEPGYEEIYARQRQEFIDPLGYMEPEQSDSELISFEDLYNRQFQEFTNPLGYEEEGGDITNDDINQPNQNNDKTELRRRRSVTGSDPFAVIAGISGGSVIHTDKANISSALGVISSATLPDSVLITRWSFNVNVRWNGSVHVDQSVYNIEIDVQTSCCKQQLKIVDPSGRILNISDPKVTVTTNTSTLYRVKIGNPKIGIWQFKVEDPAKQTYDISVFGSSTIDFDVSYVNVNGTPVAGQPESGSNSTFVKVEPFGGDMVSNWTYLIVKATNGTTMQRIAMGRPKGSRTLRWFIVPVVWPNMDVYVGVQGLDKNGHVFTREQSSLVMPAGVRLSLDNPDRVYINTCNNQTVLQYTVKNVGSPKNFTVTVLTNTAKFDASIQPSQFKLTNILPQHLNCTISLKLQQYHDNVANVNVQVIASDGTIQYSQHNLITRILDCRNITQHSTLPWQHSTPSTRSSTSSMTSSFVFVTMTTILASKCIDWT